MKELQIAILTHSGSTIGGGHLTRCVSLAETLRQNHCDILWLLNSASSGILQRSGQNIRIYDDPFDPLEIKTFPESDCFLVDSYQTTIDFYARLKDKAPLVVIDDFRDRPLEKNADILVNYNLGAEKIPYIKKNDQHFLLGPQYALIRKEYRDLEPSRGHYCLFVAGSADIQNTSEKMVELWEESWPSLLVVLGPLIEAEQIKKVTSLSAERTNIRVAISPENFPELVAGAKLIICTSSVTAYEALSLRKPIVVFQVADNQIAIGREIQEQGLGINLGFWGNWGKQQLQQAISKPLWEPPQVVNPRGAELAAEEIMNWLKRG